MKLIQVLETSQRARSCYWPIFLAGFSLASAQTPGRVVSSVVQEAQAPQDIDRLGRLPSTVFQDTLEILKSPTSWDGSDWKSFAVGSLAVIGTAIALDRPVEDAFNRNRTGALDRAAKHMSDVGVYGSMAAAGTFYLCGKFMNDPEATATGTDAIASGLISGGVIVPILKTVIGRDRPSRDHGPYFFKPVSGSDSGFPSVHTTVAFSVAAVITAHYQDPWVQCLAYGVAGLTSLARIAGNDHYTSDVVAGALIGLGVGKAIVGMNRTYRFGKRASISLAPDFRLNGYTGLQAHLIF